MMAKKDKINYFEWARKNPLIRMRNYWFGLENFADFSEGETRL